MKPGGGKTKGRTFERLICKKLSIWITRGERDDILEPSILSGGRATNQYKKTGSVDTAHQSGDIAMSHAAAQGFINNFSIECKHYKDMGLDAMFFYEPKKSISRNTTGLIGWWIQCSGDAIRVNKHPLLIVQQNNRPIMVGMSSYTKQSFITGWHSALCLGSKDMREWWWAGYFSIFDLWLVRADYFFLHADPESFNRDIRPDREILTGTKGVS